MIEQIAHLIEYYSNNYEFADDEFINTALSILVEHNSLSKYTKTDVIVNDAKLYIGNGFAAKNVYGNGIKIFRNGLHDIVTKECLDNIIFLQENYDEKNLENLKENILKKFNRYLYNIKVINVILHEIEHVKQVRNYEKEDNFETILTNLNHKIGIRYVYLNHKMHGTSFLYVIEPQNFKVSEENYGHYKSVVEYIKKYANQLGFVRFEPSEKYAKLHSLNTILEIINALDTDDIIKEILIYIYLQYKNLYTFIEPYGLNVKTFNPLGQYVNYLKFIGEYFTDTRSGEEIDKIILDKTNNLNLTERIYYNLEITEQEYKDIANGKIKIL